MHSTYLNSPKHVEVDVVTVYTDTEEVFDRIVNHLKIKMGYVSVGHEIRIAPTNGKPGRYLCRMIPKNRAGLPPWRQYGNNNKCR